MQKEAVLKSVKLRRWLTAAFILVLLSAILLSVFIQTKEIHLQGFDSQRVMEHIKELSKDEYGGRKVGTEGNERATQYIKDQFEQMGIVPFEQLGGYEMPFTTMVPIFKSPSYVRVSLSEGQMMELERNKDFIERIDDYAGSGELKGELLYVTEYEQIDNNDRDFLKDKIILIDYSKIQQANEDKIDYFIHLNSGLGIIYLENNVKDKDLSLEEKFNLKRHLVKVGVSQDVFGSIVSAIEEGKKPRIEAGVFVDFEVNVPAKNIVGYLPGKGAFKDEIVIVSANFDGLGTGYYGDIYNGAVDNSSGTAMMLEMARVLSSQKEGSRKTIIFAAMNAGEIDNRGVFNFIYQKLFPNYRAKAVHFGPMGMKDGDLEILAFDRELMKQGAATISYEDALGSMKQRIFYGADGNLTPSETFVIKENKLNRKPGLLYINDMLASMKDAKGDANIRLSFTEAHMAYNMNSISAITIAQSSALNIDRRFDDISMIDESQLSKQGNIISQVLADAIYNQSTFSNFTTPILKTIPLLGAFLVMFLIKWQIGERYAGSKISKLLRKKPLLTYGFVFISCFWIWAVQWYFNMKQSSGFNNVAFSEVEYSAIFNWILYSIFPSFLMLFTQIYLFLFPLLLLGFLYLRRRDPLPFKVLFSVLAAAMFTIGIYMGKTTLDEATMTFMPEILRISTSHFIYPTVIFLLSIGTAAVYYFENKHSQGHFDKNKLLLVFVITTILLFTLFYSPYFAFPQAVEMRRFI